jgi:hypothetical protein
MAIMTILETTAHSWQAQRLRWQNVLQIIDLVATDQLIIGKILWIYSSIIQRIKEMLLVLLAGLCSVIINL